MASSISTVHLDTHVVVWLHAGALRELTPRVKGKLESSRLVISPAVLLELDFLHEIGRIAGGAEPVLAALSSSLGLAVSDAPFLNVVEAARAFPWTRDPFDRLIVGQSDAEQCELITRDRTIRKQYRRAYWR